MGACPTPAGRASTGSSPVAGARRCMGLAEAGMAGARSQVLCTGAACTGPAMATAAQDWGPASGPCTCCARPGCYRLADSSGAPCKALIKTVHGRSRVRSADGRAPRQSNAGSEKNSWAAAKPAGSQLSPRRRNAEPVRLPGLWSCTPACQPLLDELGTVPGATSCVIVGKNLLVWAGHAVCWPPPCCSAQGLCGMLAAQLPACAGSGHLASSNSRGSQG